MSARAKPSLTGFYVFMAAKREELNGRHLSMNETLQLWKALPESERKDFEDRALEEQKRYLTEYIAIYEQRQQSGATDEAEEEEEELPLRFGAEELTVQLPIARVSKIIKLNNEIIKIGRDATFLVSKAAEQFVERTTWDAARATIRTQRKTITHRDLVTSMREHTNPESMQIFVEELQAQPTEPAPVTKAKVTKKRPAKGDDASSSRKQQGGAKKETNPSRKGARKS